MTKIGNKKYNSFLFQKNDCFYGVRKTRILCNLNLIIKNNALALMKMESLDGINLFFLVLAKRPPHLQPLSKREGSQKLLPEQIEKKVYDRELGMYSRRLLHTFAKAAPEK
jgi:hypothetical protein